jgi:hypothetical protein
MSNPKSAIGNRQSEIVMQDPNQQPSHPQQPQQPQQPQPPRRDPTLSEISHLFLSSVRDRQTGGPTSRPKRTPPAQPVQPPRAEHAIDLTPEEFAEVFGTADGAQDQSQEQSSDRDAASVPQVTAVIAAHLNGHQNQRVREYAAHLCKSGQRVGIIEVDASEFRLSFFELGNSSGAGANGAPQTINELDGRRMAEALAELSWDVDHWLLHVPNPRLTEARSLLRRVRRWTVLATCDHDGVVSCYRTLKGLADLHRADPQLEGHTIPTLSLALLDARDELLAMRVFRKLSGVCQQFLAWPLESEAPVEAAGSVVEHAALISRATRDKAQLASAPQWQVVSDFLTQSREQVDESSSLDIEPAVSLSRPSNPGSRLPEHGRKHVVAESETRSPEPALVHADPAVPEIIDLPAGADTAAAIVSATLRGASEMIECPLKPPMLADASLAVTRDRRLVLVSVARQGLSDLRLIGEAYRWMSENRALIAMAMPQLSIDAHQLPHLRLLVDRADLPAATLQPLLASSNVTVHTYRKLRWGPKTGLLLEAA